MSDYEYDESALSDYDDEDEFESESNDSWGLQTGKLSLEDSMSFGYAPEDETNNPQDMVQIGSKFKFPLEIVYQVLFVGGKRGSGKSWTSAVLMEEFERHGLQFVCFDALDAHGHLCELDGIESIEPQRHETINMKKLVERLQQSGSSLIINMSGLGLEMQQRLIADYCEGILETMISDKGLMTFFEECQDFIPQMGRPQSFAPIVRLCKLGRAKGYGVALISQRPAAVSKEALSQASVYMIHNIINTKDLNALKEQLSFGTDKATINKILSGITYAESGDMVCYAPEYYKDQGYVVVGRVDNERRTQHKGKNINVVSKLSQPMNPMVSFNDTYSSDTSKNLSKSPHSFSDAFSADNDSNYDDSDDDNEIDMESENKMPQYEWSATESEELYSSVPEIKNNFVKGAAIVSIASSAFYILSRFIVSGRRG